MRSPRSAADRSRIGPILALCPDCDGVGRTLVTFGLLRSQSDDAARMGETVALRECAVCEGYGWSRAADGR